MTTINLNTLIKLTLSQVNGQKTGLELFLAHSDDVEVYVEIPEIIPDGETIAKKLQQIDLAMVELQQAKQYLIDSDPEYSAYLERYQKFASAPPLTFANYYNHKEEFALLIDGLDTADSAALDQAERKLFYLRHRLAY